MRQAAVQRRPERMLRWLVALAISGLTLADGVLHLRLNYLLFGGTLWGKATPGGGHPPGPPPGAAGPPAGGPPPGHGGGNPFPLPLNEMFFLNFLAAVGLVLAFWVAWRWLPRWLWLVDLALVAFAAFSIWGWWDVGKPNPQNLGMISKTLEVALIVAVAAHGWLALRLRGSGGQRIARLRNAAQP